MTEMLQAEETAPRRNAKPAQAQKTKQRISRAQIEEQRASHDRLTDALNNARELAEKKNDQLATVKQRKAKAERLLELTDGSIGFDTERQRAESVIADCLQQLAELERLAAGREATVHRIEGELRELDKSQFAKLSEIDKLARELRTSVS